ncbi:MAG: type II and III secretion system protein, partial [Holophagales bacterium]|nr:type II and III secretion system protein [Holophagales bacterium]
DQQTITGIPGLSDLPILGRLFSNTSNQGSRTDIVLTLTPHVIRRASIEEADLLPIWVGTEANMTFRGGSPRVESDVEGPFDGDDEARDRVRDRLRERLRSLPRGLQDAGAGEEQEAAPPVEQPRGRDLAPTGGFRDPFAPDPDEEEGG